MSLADKNPLCKTAHLAGNCVITATLELNLFTHQTATWNWGLGTGKAFNIHEISRFHLLPENISETKMGPWPLKCFHILLKGKLVLFSECVTDGIQSEGKTPQS